MPIGVFYKSEKRPKKEKEESEEREMAGYLIIGVIVGIIVAVVVVISKKDAKDQAELISQLTPEQKARIEAAKPDFGKQNEWVQEAMVARVTEKGSKLDLRLLWFDTVMSGGEITIADAAITKAEQQAHNVQAGSFVKLYIAPDKSVGSVKVVFD